MKRYLLTVAASMTLLGPVTAQAATEPLILNMATQPHPHVKALQDGQVGVQGCEVHFSTQSLSELMQDLTSDKKFDVLEVDLGPYLEKKSAGEYADYMLIPVFLSRGFQMRNIYIRTDRGIHHPEDLRGKTVGVSGLGSTTATWLKGILQSSWNVKPSEITWLDTETTTGTSRSLSAWLSSGKVDAIFSPDPPKGLDEKDAKITRLFTDYQRAENDTFQVTRVFPILTALAIRQSIVDKNPWVPEAIFNAFSEAKKKAMADLTLPLPWGGSQLEETEKVMGKNFWSYGVPSNPKTLGALFRYIDQQKLFQHPLKLDDVFESSTMMLMEP